MFGERTDSVRWNEVETPIFRAIVAEKRIEARPMTEVIKLNWREIILSERVA